MTQSQRRWRIHENARFKLIEDRKQRLFVMKKHDISVISRDGLIGVFMGRKYLAFFTDYENERESNIRRLIYSVTRALEIKEKEGINDC